MALVPNDLLVNVSQVALPLTFYTLAGSVSLRDSLNDQSMNFKIYQPDAVESDSKEFFDRY